jgi:hypothetical protein
MRTRRFSQRPGRVHVENTADIRWDFGNITADLRYDVDEPEKASIMRRITVLPSLSAEQRERLAEVAERTPVTAAIRAPIATEVLPSSTPGKSTAAG